MVVLVLALLLALAMLVAVVVAPLLADARGRNPPRLVTRAGKNNAPKVVSAVVFVVAFVLLLGFFISKIINKLCLPINPSLRGVCGARARRVASSLTRIGFRGMS